MPVHVDSAALFLAFYPFVSVWIVSRDVVEVAPVIDGVGVVDQYRPFRALVGSDFVLASRTYIDTNHDEVRLAFLAGGFEVSSRGGISVPARHRSGTSG